MLFAFCWDSLHDPSKLIGAEVSMVILILILRGAEVSMVILKLMGAEVSMVILILIWAEVSMVVDWAVDIT